MMDVEVIAIKGYFILVRSQQLKPNRQMQFSVIHKMPFLKGSYSSVGDTVSIFYGGVSAWVNAEKFLQV